MKTQFLFFAILSMLILNTSCNLNPKVSTISATPTIISNEIESAMPGELLITDQYILWCDPFNTENNTFILDKKSETKIGKFVKKGNGPNEFNTPFTSILSYENNSILTYEPSNKKQITFSIDKYKNKQEEIIDIRENDIQNITNIISIENDILAYFSPISQKPFTLKGPDIDYSFGHLPLADKISNSYSVYQGKIAYNSEKKLFIYSTFQFPYLAVYKHNEGNMELLKETSVSNDYSISNNELRFNSQDQGIFEMALTNNYIVTVEKENNNDTNNKNSGRDFNQLPQTIFLYNYNLELVKIINLGMPILRIASNPKEKTIYLIGLKDDFVLAKYVIED